MSYPAQNTQSEFDCLVNEVIELRYHIKTLCHDDSREILKDSEKRLRETFRNRDMEELFNL